MHGSFIFGIIFISYNETERNLKIMQSDYVISSRDTSRVAIHWKTVSPPWQIGYGDVINCSLFSKCLWYIPIITFMLMVTSLANTK